MILKCVCSVQFVHLYDSCGFGKPMVQRVFIVWFLTKFHEINDFFTTLRVLIGSECCFTGNVCVLLIGLDTADILSAAERCRSGPMQKLHL